MISFLNPAPVLAGDGTISVTSCDSLGYGTIRVNGIAGGNARADEGDWDDRGAGRGDDRPADKHHSVNIVTAGVTVIPTVLRSAACSRAAPSS